MPNLARLQIKKFRPFFGHPYTTGSSISGPLQLVRLNIVCDLIEDNFTIRSIETLLNWFKLSLEELTFSIQTFHPFNTQQLESIFKRCERLRKLHFAIQYNSKTINGKNLLLDFQTDWWLNSERPPILIIYTKLGRTLITTMPCESAVYINFPTNMNRWLLNKENDSSPIKFKNTRLITFDNSNRQPITDTLLYFIKHVFRASHQKLCLDYWGFNSTEVIFEQVIFSVHDTKLNLDYPEHMIIIMLLLFIVVNQ